LRENIVLALQARQGWWRPLSKPAQTEIAQQAVEKLKITTTDIEKPVAHLSGGNQQKAILARWLAINPELLILDEPTRGIDIGAHVDILRLIRALCERGMALLVSSSELEELVAFSHKVIVMRDREQVTQLRGAEISEQNIMQAIASGAEA
jgi:simple sugar transport system ATP-binding protein